MLSPSGSGAAPFTWLLRKEWRELMTSRSWWVFLTLMGPLVGVAFIAAVGTYGEASGLGGVLPFDAGRFLVDGQPMTPAARSALVFYLPDSIVPWPTQTVRWVLDFVRGYFRGSALTRDRLIEQLGLAPLLDVPIGTLSKGQRKRALLAIGLLTPQPVLLADEPFEGLDLRQTREVAQTLRAWAARGRTLFLSIHQIGDAARVCDRFVLLSGGRSRGEGSIAELAALAALRTGTTPDGHDLEEVFLALT